MYNRWLIMAFEIENINVIHNNYSMRCFFKINGSEYTESNIGHVRIHAYGKSHLTDFNAYQSFKVTNNDGYVPALIINLGARYNTAGTYRTYGMTMSIAKLNTMRLVVSDVNIDSSYPGEGGIFSGLNINYGVSDANQDAFTLTVEIDADIPIFIGTPVKSYDDDRGYGYTISSNSTIETYANEVCHGTYDNLRYAANFINVIDSIPSDLSYYIDSTLKVNGHITSQKAFNFQIQPNSKIVLYQDEAPTGNASPNMHLVISKYPVLVKRRSDPDSSYTEVSTVDTEYWHSGYWKDINTGVNYTGICSTNIPIFRGQSDAQKYLDGDLDISDAINGGSLGNKDSTIGEDLRSSDIDTVNLATSGVGCYIYALSEAQIKDLMENYLYVTDQTTIDGIRDGIWYWGNNPIDFFIDCYYIPFSIDNFYDTVNANMKFGTYQFVNGSTFPAVKESNGDRIVLFDTTFEGVYGDWRDYTQFKYDLYLPFYGFFPLDLFKYLNHNVRCEMMFDITTHNIRYYLFVDGIITDRIDSSVGINLPLMASDYVNKAKSDRQTERAMEQKTVNMTLQAAKNGMDIGGAIVSGNPVAAVNNGISAVGNVANGMYDLAALSDKAKENASQSIHGSFSAAMNIYDIKYAYLRITEDQMILPEKIHELYNYPSYYVGSASALSGYCEISDIRLKSFTGTVEEANALKSALMEGIIL